MSAAAISRLAASALWACGLLVACAKAPPAVIAVPMANREPDQYRQKDPLLSETTLAHAVVAEAFVTAARAQDNLDSPTSWTTPDGKRWVIATAKNSGKLIVFDGDSGRWLRSVGGNGNAPGRMERPNGIAVVGDTVLVVERDNHRVQMFALPGFESLLTFAADDLRKPYGLWAYEREGGVEVVVSDNYMSGADQETVPPLSELGQRFRHYRLTRTAPGWTAALVQTFGDTGRDGAVRIAESVFGDPAHDRLLLAEEDVAAGTRLREYGLADGRYRGRDLGAGLYKAQAEGIALLACTDGSGYWIGTDQFKDRSVFHLFDRQTLAHVGAFAGKVTANTDGVWMDRRGDARFPQGVFYALHDDQAVAAFDWRDVTAALRLRHCTD